MNGVKIIGTVLMIDNALLSTDTTSPCAKTPCIANIKIDEVTARGSRLSDAVSSGMIINANFAFTLSGRSREFFPAMNVDLPELRVGDKFEGNIEIMPDTNGGLNYVVLLYRKIK